MFISVSLYLDKSTTNGHPIPPQQFWSPFCVPGAALWRLPALSPYIRTAALQDRPDHYPHHVSVETGT